MTLDELEIKRLKRKCFYTRKETDEMLKNISQKIVVDELPLTGIENYLYAIPTQNENEYNQYVWNNNLWESLGTVQDTLTDYVTQPELELELNKKKLYTEVTWQELKDLRDNSKLSQGSLYRITDYQCTTTLENTQSAGHLFDIVLLALSNNKLAEEGWAMMHDNIYDITFMDGVTKKCYFYDLSGDLSNMNLVDISTKLGYSEANDGDLIFNDNGTITSTTIDSTSLTEKNLPYNYFQNSNLSAWKVWYCLDNNKVKYGWADDSVPAYVNSKIVIGTKPNAVAYTRYSQGDVIFDKQYYAWKTNSIIYFTDTETPISGESSYYTEGKNGMDSVGVIRNFVPEQSIGGDGRGVIYRLIDEWNNDVFYDFKNIQFVRPTSDGQYNEGGENTWCYTFSINGENGIIDASMGIVYSNKICRSYELSDNVKFGEGSGYIDVFSRSCTILNSYAVLYGTEYKVIKSDSGIFFGGKKVLTEE